MNKVISGQTVNVHYVGTFDDGTEFDNSRARDQVLSFEVGSGMLIPGFEAALAGMAIGEKKTVRLAKDEAYGEPDPAAKQVVPRASFPEDFEFILDGVVAGNTSNGQQAIARIESFDDEEVMLDFNHPMAGKALNFEIELLSINSEEE